MEKIPRTKRSGFRLRAPASLTPAKRLPLTLEVSRTRLFVQTLTIKVKSKTNVNGSGQECPLYTGV
jgi:hypothetical protein